MPVVGGLNGDADDYDEQQQQNCRNARHRIHQGELESGGHAT